MSFSDLFGSGEHLRNLGHFASIVNLAAVDGAINPQEEIQLKRFAEKLDISKEEYSKVLKNPTFFPLNSCYSIEQRLERLYDLFQIIFSDNSAGEVETELLKKYAIGLGFSSEASEKIIKRSINIFRGQIDYDDYLYLLSKEE